MRIVRLAFTSIALAFICSCSGRGNSQNTPLPPTPSSVSLALSATSITLPQGGSIGRLNATITRVSSTGSFALSITGLPVGASATFQQPGVGNTGNIALNPGTAPQGTYPLTVQASDGVYSGTANLSFVIGAGQASLLPHPLSWISTAPIISAIPDATHAIISVKDPSVVYFNNSWHVYATTADTSGHWNMVYLNFADWSQATAAKPYYMDATPGLAGYHCAPQVFYFTPQKKWYLIYQSGPPQYSTTSDLSKPATWSAPQSFFASQPSTVKSWLDFWVICDAANCYLFFSGDDGNFYRSQTTVASFPQGFSNPIVIMQAAKAGDLFEGSNTYKLKGLNQYLTLVEAIGANGHRYFRAFVSDRLDGDWTPIPDANSWAAPFAGINNVAFDTGVPAWTNDISHGEMLRDGYDETMTIDPGNLQFLYQGANPNAKASDYSQIPWQLGLIRKAN